MKTCSKCLVEKPVSEFYTNKSKPSGVESCCKSCAKSYAIAYRKANLEKVKERQSILRVKNKEKHRAYTAAWYLENAIKVREAAAKWRLDNPEKTAENIAKWRENNPEAMKIHCQNRRAREKTVFGALSKDLSDKLFKLQRGKCACCNSPLGDDYHLDHITPLALGGTNTDDNIQLLRARCNLQKHAKHPIDFMQSRGFLL